MTLNIYIGLAKHLEEGDYFINRRGESYIEDDSFIFEDFVRLLKGLADNYKDRKARLVGIDKDIPEDEKQRIFDFIEGRNLKIEIPRGL